VIVTAHPDDPKETALGRVPPERQPIVKRLLAHSFAVPMIWSFSMDGSPLDESSPTDVEA
jgi:hypothetical protein